MHSSLLKTQPGGLEKVDVETGQCLIRHPISQELRIVNYPPDQAAKIKAWHDQKSDPKGALIQDVLPFLNDDQREELLSGLTGKEYDESFADTDPASEPKGEGEPLTE